MYMLINILGLSLGIACAILIFVLVRYHLSFDNFHPDSDRIYRINTEFHDDGTKLYQGVPAPLGRTFAGEFPFAEKMARVATYENALISLPGGNRKFVEEKGVAFADASFFDIFSFPLERGTWHSDANTALITQSLAKKYFGDVDAIGQTIRYNEKGDFVIRGILKDLPTNTDRDQEIYLSFDNLRDYSSATVSDSNWGGVYSGFQCFLKLSPGIQQARVEHALHLLSHEYYEGDDVHTFEFKLQPLSDIHFNTDMDGYADKKYLWAVALVGLFLIVTACVNFVNLATAQALNRSREIGVRKVLGSQPIHVFWQFISETALITFLALFLGLGLAWAALPYLNGLFGAHMALDLFGTWSLGVYLLVTGVFVTFLAGSYPAVLLSRFLPVLALKGRLDQRHIGGFSMRRILVVLQFSISQLLIIGTLVIARQIFFSKHADLGFVKDGIVTLPLPVSDPVKMTTLRNRLSEQPGVRKASLCYDAPASENNSSTDIRFKERAVSESWQINVKQADDQYLSAFGLRLVAGRNLFPSDTATGCLLNELAVRKLHAGTPAQLLGRVVIIDGIETPIVGVVRDFNDHSFRGSISPVAIFSQVHEYRNCAVRIDMGNMQPTLDGIRRIWEDTYPAYVYSQTFLDDNIARFYELDDIMLRLVEVFAGIAIFIGCLGLYGLVSFMAVRKTKEIGVRKVLGAGLADILWLFGREFLRLLVLAFAIAAPAAWWFMHRYLQEFQYRITMGWDVFVPALGGTFLVAALTVSYRSWKAASAEPVKSLRSE